MGSMEPMGPIGLSGTQWDSMEPMGLNGTQWDSMVPMEPMGPMVSWGYGVNRAIKSHMGSIGSTGPYRAI